MEKTLKIEITQGEYQAIQFCLRWTHQKFYLAREQEQLSSGLRMVLLTGQQLMDGKFKRVIGEVKVIDDPEDHLHI